MIPPTVERLLTSDTPTALADFFDDESTFFWVDWREYDDMIVQYCEDLLQTGDLSAEVIDSDAAPGAEIYISHAGRRVKVPTVDGHWNRHTTLYTLNELLKPAYEIRVAIDSNGSDTLAFLPLPAADWSTLESQFGSGVAKRFRKIEERPDLFNDVW